VESLFSLCQGPVWISLMYFISHPISSRLIIAGAILVSGFEFDINFDVTIFLSVAQLHLLFKLKRLANLEKWLFFIFPKSSSSFFSWPNLGGKR
jgi:hypothetical protein